MRAYAQRYRGAGRTRARGREQSRSRRGADRGRRARLSQAARRQGRVGSRAPVRGARIPAGAGARVRRLLSAAFPYRRLAVRPARSGERADEKGRSRALGDDRVPGHGAAQIPARHVARSVPLERRAQARAAPPRRIRGRRRGSHRRVLRRRPIAIAVRVVGAYETIRGYGHVKEASAAEAAKTRAGALAELTGGARATVERAA